MHFLQETHPQHAMSSVTVITGSTLDAIELVSGQSVIVAYTISSSSPVDADAIDGKESVLLIDAVKAEIDEDRIDVEGWTAEEATLDENT